MHSRPLRSSATSPETGFRSALAAARPELLQAARRLTSGSDAAAEDLVQDALTRALESSRGYDPERAIVPWLRRILLNVHIDRVRREARRGPATDVEPDHLGRESEPLLDRAEELQLLAQALGEPGRSLLWRFHHDGLSIGELSREFGLPAGTIKSHLHRARRQLAASFTLGPGSVLERQDTTRPLPKRPAPRSPE